MVNCSYCKKELDREVFCSPSHRTMFNRDKQFKGGALKKGFVGTVPKTVEDLKVVPVFPGKLCPKHGVSPMGHGWHS